MPPGGSTALDAAAGLVDRWRRVSIEQFARGSSTAELAQELLSGMNLVGSPADQRLGAGGQSVAVGRFGHWKLRFYAMISQTCATIAFCFRQIASIASAEPIMRSVGSSLVNLMNADATT